MMSRLGVPRELRARARPSALSAWLPRMFGSIMASSLARNAYALMTSIVVTSVLGIFFWVLAGRLFEQAAVGIGSVLINTAMTISVVTRLSLNNVLQRFLPGTGPGASGLVLGALAIGGVLGCLAAFAFALLAGTFMPDLLFLSNSWALSALFAATVAIWAIYSLLESTLSALRAAHWVPVFSISSSVLKIGALIGASMFAANALGLLAAWIIPILPAAVLGSYLVFRVLLPRSSKGGKPLARLGTMTRFCTFDYFAGLAPTIAIAAAPLIVLNYAGPETTAQFYIGWLIAYSIYLMGHSMGVSLLAESVFAGERIASLTGQAIVQAALPITGASIAIALLALFLMSLFGPEYRGGAVMLQLLALSCIPWVLETIFLAVARAKDWLPAILGIQWLNLVLVLSLGLFLVPRIGGSGMAMAWLLAQMASVLVILIGTIVTFGVGRTLNTAVILLGGSTRAVSGMVHAPKGAAPAAARDGSLETSALASLHADPRLGQLRHLLPQIALEPQDSAKCAGTHLIETRHDWTQSFADAVDAIAHIRASTASRQTISSMWTATWISQPLAAIGRMERSHGAAAAIENHMLAFWSNRDVELGIVHRNLDPGSLLFGAAGTFGGPPALASILGWSHMRWDGPAGFDICHLALTTRMAVRDQELGPVVHDLLNGGIWSDTERRWLAHESTAGDWLRDADLMREMVLLAWVDHMARGFDEYPACTTNRAWLAVNFDWVLRQAKRYVSTR